MGGEAGALDNVPVVVFQACPNSAFRRERDVIY